MAKRKKKKPTKKKWVLAEPPKPVEHDRKRRTAKAVGVPTSRNRPGKKKFVLFEPPPEPKTTVLRVEMIDGSGSSIRGRIRGGEGEHGTIEEVVSWDAAAGRDRYVGMAAFCGGIPGHGQVNAYWPAEAVAPNGYCFGCDRTDCAGVAWAEHALVTGLTQHELPDNLPF